MVPEMGSYRVMGSDDEWCRLQFCAPCSRNDLSLLAAVQGQRASKTGLDGDGQGPECGVRCVRTIPPLF